MRTENEIKNSHQNSETAGEEILKVKVKSYSKGGLIAAIILSVAMIGVIITKPQTPYTIIGYVCSIVALVIRSFRPPIKWWQIILVWIGGLTAGMSTSVLENVTRFPQGAIPVFLIFLGIGVILIWLGFRSKPIAKEEYKVEHDIQEAKTIHSYTEIFNLKNYGINYYVGFGFLIASILIPITYYYYDVIMGRSYDTFSSIFSMSSFINTILITLIFVTLIHVIQKDWLLALIFGVAETLVFGLTNIIFNGELNFSFDSLLFWFISAFLFMSGFVFSIKIWGPRIWSLLIGFTICIFVPLIIHNSIINKTFILFSSLYTALAVFSIIQSIFYSVFIYFCIYLHLWRRGFKLDHSTIVRRTA